MPPHLRFDHIKSNFFRVVHSDGVWIAPYGPYLHVTFFNERIPIPQQTTHKVKLDGNFDAEDVAKRVGRDAIVRELEVDVVVNLDAAKVLRTLLDQSISMLEARLARQTGP